MMMVMMMIMMTPSHTTVKKGDLEVVTKLLLSNVDVDAG